MPVMDGFEATIKLKEMMKNNEIDECPIVALSANNSEEDRKKTAECGMVDHIGKPL